MSSLFLFSASITLVVLLSILPLPTAHSHPIDIDGLPILNKGQYYIIPVTGKSGLTYTQKGEECPLYITEEKTVNSPGTPVQINVATYPPFVIGLDIPIVLTFKSSTPCNESLVWTLTLDPESRMVYFTTGGLLTLPIAQPFFITKTDRTGLPTYELKFSPTPWADEKFNVGIQENGLLGITDHPTTVYFKKAVDNVLELSTS